MENIGIAGGTRRKFYGSHSPVMNYENALFNTDAANGDPSLWDARF